MKSYSGPEIGAKSVIALASLKTLESLGLSHSQFKFADMYHMIQVQSRLITVSKIHKIYFYHFFRRRTNRSRVSA